MELKEFLDKYGIPSIESPKEAYNELKDQFLEMSQIKSDFDIEKFTVKKEGNFIAHNFHFLMRQYSLALSELRRMDIDRKVKLREIKRLETLGNEIIYWDGKDTYADLEIERLVNDIDMLDLNIANKLIMCDRFEKARIKIIELNKGKAPTNKQYQKEEPEYWKWLLERKAIWQHQQASTGIHEGVWENIDHLEQPALINPAFQIEVKKYSEKDKTRTLPLPEIYKRHEDLKKLKQIE